MTGMLDLHEDATYRFDPEAADRPCRFVEKYLRHFEGRFAGQPFILHDAQRRIVRDLFGWRNRETGQRRFTDCYWEGAVGCGKSPTLAAIGLYGLMADGEQGAQVYSLASTYTQARIVFETAQRFVAANSELDRRLNVVEREIRHPASGSVWRIVSGKGPGAGPRPSMILGDEVHQWASAGAYNDLRTRAGKREQPLTIMATNAGQSRASFCWQLREKAVAALQGKGEPTLYPVIWAADEGAATDDPAAWRAANPLLGTTITEDKVRAFVTGAMVDPAEEADARRLYLGIWPKVGAGRWLDLNLWDAATGLKDASPPDAPAYFGLDLSQSDDLCAALRVDVTAERFYVSPHFWVPKATAERYEQQHAVPFAEWAKADHIELLEEPTISPAVRRRIAAWIIAAGKGRTVKAVCYDRYNADETVAALEAAGMTCVPVAQGYSVSPGCFELDRRLKERSISIEPNPVLRWNAENAEAKGDDRGNIWIAKPAAHGRYAGTRWRKVDGLTALVTALTEARKHAFPAAQKQSKAKAWII